MRPAASAPLLACLLAACSSSPVVPPEDSGATLARVELGTGTSTFVALPATGGTMELVHGPQGGYHVEVATRLWGLAPEGLVLTYSARRTSDGTVVSTTPYVLTAARVVREGDHLLRAGDITIFDVADPPSLVGQTIEVTVTARLPDGSIEVSDSRTVTIADAIM
jgi:hypothetical protein